MDSLLNSGNADTPPATLASRGNRLLAFVIDNSLAIVGAPLLRTVIPPGVASSTIIAIVAGLWLLALAITQIMLLGMRGQSIGKYITRAAIVDQFSNEPPGYLRAAVIRQGPQAVLSNFFPITGVLYLVLDGLFIFSERRRCLHDRLAGTVVIRVSKEWP